MAGKGRKRREKNYRAAHGGSTALPPPPKSSQLDALPFKLRQIISFTKHQNGSFSFPFTSSLSLSTFLILIAFPSFQILLPYQKTRN
jgi:hypothetical protein